MPESFFVEFFVYSLLDKRLQLRSWLFANRLAGTCQEHEGHQKSRLYRKHLDPTAPRVKPEGPYSTYYLGLFGLKARAVVAERRIFGQVSFHVFKNSQRLRIVFEQ